jgi:aspartate aminotransferase-like enzyme
MTNQNTIKDFVKKRNDTKILFTAGPASLLEENITGLRPAFGRGDDDYINVEEKVLNALKNISGHSMIARMQGSASLAIEIMILNFLYGKVLIINTGFYSERLNSIAESACRRVNAIKKIEVVNWSEIDKLGGTYDWILTCYTETSLAIKIDLKYLKSISTKLNSKIMLDATASIGLEDNHDLADVIAFSSCKGLFGLTGASFISFNEMPKNEIDSFYLSLTTHLEKKLTGPYHSIASLLNVLTRHDYFKAAVIENKAKFLYKMKNYLVNQPSNEPLLCTQVAKKIISNDKRVILYNSRSNISGSIICHLGEVHKGSGAEGEIINLLEIK